MLKAGGGGGTGCEVNMRHFDISHAEGGGGGGDAKYCIPSEVGRQEIPGPIPSSCIIMIELRFEVYNSLDLKKKSFL